MPYAVIDQTTGTVLGADNLTYVEATERQLDKACDSDHGAFMLAQRKTKTYHISPELLDALMRNDPEAIALCLGYQAEVDNSGQVVLYTDQRPKRRG